VLADFRTRRDPNTSRKEYIDRLQKDLCMYYSYNDFLVQKFFELLPHEVSEASSNEGVETLSIVGLY
jgi:ribosomal RNA methyltransferase Nop2